MRALLVTVLVLVGCGDDVQTDPDAALEPDAEPVQVYDYCERLNAPPSCYDDPCEMGGERVCATERMCQQWDDDVCDCFQCRQMFQCWCER